MSVTLSLVALALPFALGVFAALRRLFPSVDAAIEVLHRVTLHVAFPALVVVGLTDPRAEVARHPAYVALVPGAALACAALVAFAPGGARRWRGTLGLVVAFGNTAYLGFPYVSSVLGPSIVATLAVAVAAHVAVSMTLGPALLARWGGEGTGARAAIARLARQPLLWSPLVGLAARLLPLAAIEPLRAVLEPLGRLAAPLSMLLLGLYVGTHRGALRVDRAVALHVAVRLGLLPAITLGLALAARALGLLDVDEARVLVLLAAMPAAITTFSIAREQGADASLVAAVIVGTTVLAPLTLAAWTAAVFAAF